MKMYVKSEIDSSFSLSTSIDTYTNTATKMSSIQISHTPRSPPSPNPYHKSPERHIHNNTNTSLNSYTLMFFYRVCPAEWFDCCCCCFSLVWLTMSCHALSKRSWPRCSHSILVIVTLSSNWMVTGISSSLEDISLFARRGRIDFPSIQLRASLVGCLWPVPVGVWGVGGGCGMLLNCAVKLGNLGGEGRNSGGFISQSPGLIGSEGGRRGIL